MGPKRPIQPTGWHKCHMSLPGQQDNNLSGSRNSPNRANHTIGDSHLNRDNRYPDLACILLHHLLHLELLQEDPQPENAGERMAYGRALHHGNRVYGRAGHQYNEEDRVGRAAKP